MPDLIINFQLHRQPTLALARVLERLVRVAAGVSEVKEVSIKRGRGRRAYVDVTFSLAAKYLPSLWSHLSSQALGRDVLGRKLRLASIIVCEGSSGWDNYKLLHHFDRTQVLDRF